MPDARSAIPATRAAHSAQPEHNAAEPSPAPATAPEPLYEVLTQTWGANPPVYQAGDTFVPSMLPDRNLHTFLSLGVIGLVSEDDPRQHRPPTGPTAEQTGVPSDGWATQLGPEVVPPHLAAQVAAALARQGAAPELVARVRALAAPATIPMAEAVPSTVPGAGTPAPAPGAVGSGTVEPPSPVPPASPAPA